MPLLYLIWNNNGTILTSDEGGVSLNNTLSFNINYPGSTTEVQTLSVTSSASIEQTFNTLINVKVYLTGDSTSLEIVQDIWPTLGNGYYPQRPELNGGFEISFDGGSTFIRFDSITGKQDLPATWITLLGSAVGINGEDGVLGAFDTATLLVRFTIPPGSVEYQKLNIGLALDFDVI